MLPEQILTLYQTSQGLWLLASSAIVACCVLIVFFAIFFNFISAKESSKVRQEKKSIVETGSMVGFFLLFLIALISGKWNFAVSSQILHKIIIIISTAIMLIGTYVNIIGRQALAGNWANQVRIYHDQTLVTKGVYSWIRHPLYASLIWMFLSASILYLNYLAFLFTLCVFLPFMYYRAKQEESLLLQQFKNYASYQKQVGMFFPKIW